MRIGLFVSCIALAFALAGAIIFVRGNSSPNVASARSVALGSKLFRDARISADGKTSCATCHIPGQAFSDSRPVATGIDGLRGTRNTPSLTTAIVPGGHLSSGTDAGLSSRTP